MIRLSTTWALLLIVPWVLAGPVPSATSCAAECKTSLNPKFRYAVGQAYIYNFQASSKTWMMGTSEDQAILTVAGQAVVTFRTSCEAVVQLRKTTIEGLEDSVDVKELEKRPLSFSWQDGTVESVCPEQEDPAWVVNIKRSIISMMQHTSQFVDQAESYVMESDVIGRCPTEYTVQKAAKATLVTKTKNPNQCSHRIGRLSAIPTVSYNVPAEIQTIPLMNSNSICELSIQDGFVQDTKCRETHLFRPFSTENGGARTEVTSSISLVSTAAGAAPKSTNIISSTLILDPRGVQFEFQDAKDVNSVVKSLCKTLNESPERSAQAFTELVHALRKAPHKEIKAAYNAMRSKAVCTENVKTEKLFLDALPQAGSSGAIALMAEILKDNKLTARQALGWYMSLPLAKFADLDAIKAVVPLVEAASQSPVALFGLTGMARRYCMSHVQECESSAEVQQFATKLGKLLGKKCSADPKDELKVIAVLKALGNFGIMTPEIRTAVSECAKESKLPVTIRLAAIEASRSNPCDSQIKGALMAVLEDKTEDSELRIAAYMGVMRCPSSTALRRIETMMAAEEHNQVGSYIASHLENLKANPNPGKEHVRRLVNKLNMGWSFPKDIRRFSRNLAVSDYCNINNAGWDADTHVVYSPNSFLPRSASMNLTIDLFGQSVNLFEFGLRAENLERVLEAYLGPDSPVAKEGVSGLLEKISNKAGDIGENLWNKVASARNKRATIRTSELAALDKIAQIKDKNTALKLDAYLRIFGSEIAMLNYRGTPGAEQKMKMFEGLDEKIAKAMEDLIKGAEQANIDIARSLMFLDTTVTFPTIAGFPLRLAVNGTTTLGLGLETKFDWATLKNDPLNADVKLKLSPLAVAEVSTSMTVDIAVAKTGIKMAATIHSSSAADFSARLQQSGSVEVKLELPKSKMSLIEFNSAMMLIQQTGNKAEKTNPLTVVNESTYNRGGCSERTTAFTGLRLCARSSITVPRPMADPSVDSTPAFPMSGKGHFSIVLEKSEPTMKGYVLTASTKQEGNKATSFSMTIDTPGSKTSRAMTLKGTLTTTPTLGFKVDGKAPWGGVAVEADVVNRDDKKHVELKITTNDKREFFGKVQTTVTKGDRKYSVAANVEAAWPGQARAVLFEGGFTHNVGSSLEVNFKPSGPFASWPLALQGTVGREFTATATKVSLTNFQLTTPLGKTVVSTEIGRQDSIYSANLNMKYGIAQKSYTVEFNGQVQNVNPTSKDDKTWKTAVLYKSSRFPQMNVDLKWDLTTSPTVLSNSVVLVHGPESEKTTNRLYINQYSLLKGKFATYDLDVENKLEVAYPRFAANIKLDQNFKFDNRNLKTIVLFQMDNTRVVDFDAALVFVPKDAKNIYELNAKLAYPGRTFTLTDIGKRIDDNSFAVSPVLDVQPGRKFEFDGKASLIKDASGLSVNVDSEARVTGLANPIKLRHTFQYTEAGLTTSNKIEWNGEPQVTLDGKLTMRTPTMPVVELNFLWKGRVTGKLDTRMSREESKLDLDMTFHRFQRRITYNGQHKFFGDNRSGSFNLAWDAGKDATKQIGFDGSLTFSRPGRAFDLKTIWNIENTLHTWTANGKWGAEFLNGEHAIAMEYTLPSAKKTNFNFALTNVNQARKFSTRIDLDTLAFSGTQFQTSFTTTLNDFDRAQLTFNGVTDLTVKFTGMDDIKMRFEGKRVVRGDKRNVDFKTLIIAPQWGQNIDSSLTLEVNKDSFRSKTNYQRGPMMVSVESAAKKVRTGTKTNLEGFVEVKAPKTAWQQSKIAMVTSFDITSATTFDISEKLSIVYQTTNTITFDTKFKVSPTNVDLNLMLETPFQVARRQSLTLSGRREEPRTEGSLVVSWSTPNQRQPQEARLEVEVERRTNQLSFKFTTSTPFKKFESSELSFDIRSLEDNQKYELDLIAGLSERKTKLNGRVSLVSSLREVDVTLTMPTGSPLRFLARLGAQSPSYNLETRIDWGAGTFSVEGTTKFVSIDNFDVSIKVHSAELNINNYEFKGTNKLQGKQRTIEFGVFAESAAIGTIKTTWDRKEGRSDAEISGTADVSITKPAFSGSVKYTLQSKVYDSSDEMGKSFKFEVDVTAGDLPLNKLSSQLKWTTKEKSTILRTCTSSGTCRALDLAFTDAKSSKEGHILIKLKEGGSEEVRGIRMKQSASSSKFEQTFEIVFDEAKNRLIGYKVYKKDHEYGLELFTPKHTSAATLEIVKASGRQHKSQYIVTVWMDKSDMPDRKLVLIATIEPNKMADMEGFLASFAIKHPVLSRELEYKLEFHRSTSEKKSNVAHFKIDADVLDSHHQRWTLESHVRKTADETTGRNFTAEFSLRSKGAGVSSFLTLSAGATAENMYTFGAHAKFMNKEVIQKELMARFGAGPSAGFIALGSPVKQLSWEGRWNFDRIVSYPRFQFSGSHSIFSLTPTMYMVDVNTSPQVDIRVFLKASPEKYYQILGGLLDDNRFELSLTHHTNAQKKYLAALTFSLSSPELLRTRVSWKLEDLRALVALIQTRSQAITTEISTVRSTFRSDMSAIRQKWEAFGDFKAGYEKVSTGLAKRIKMLKDEFETDESMKEATELFEAIAYGVKSFAEWIETVVERIQKESKLFDMVEKAFETAGDYVADYMKIVNSFTARWVEAVKRYVEEWKIVYGKADNFIVAFREFSAAKSAQLREYLATFRTTFDDRFNKFMRWFESFTIGNRSVYDIINEFINKPRQNAIRARLVSFVEEAVFLPLEEIVTGLAAKYPETTRPGYRYVRYPIIKIRKLLKGAEWTVDAAPQPKTTTAENKNYLYSLIGKIVVYDINNGEIVHEMPLARKVYSLRNVFQVFNTKASPFNFISIPQRLGLSTKNMINEFRAKYGPSYAFTRLRGFASLIGSKGVVTFDKKSFDVTGGCQYLLARDFLNQDFAVALNFETSGKKSVIFADGTDQVELKDEQVTVNGKAAIMPVALKNIMVSREENTILVKRPGASLKYDIPNDVFTFELSPFYVGRTMGLWGTFNNEHVDDFTEPSGKLSKDITSFASSWKINKSCKDAIQTTADAQVTSTDECSDLFVNSSSELSSCFLIVSPAPYNNLCSKMSQKAKKTDATKTHVDSLTAGYRAACQRFGISL